MFKSHILSLDVFVVFDSLLSEKVTKTRIVILQQLQLNHLSAFYLTCFARFDSRGKQVAACSSRLCALTYLCCHTYVLCVWFLRNFIF